jgi:hypothetical protein
MTGRSAAVGLLLGLGENELRSAIILAVSQAAGTFAAGPATADGADLLLPGGAG